MIYIYCPAASYTGGPTLAHQLCYALLKSGINAAMWYDCNPIKKLYIDPVHLRYRHFNNPFVLSEPKDTNGTTIIALESKVSILNRYKFAKRYIWWMSVDNYFLNMGNFYDYIKIKFGLMQPSLNYCKKYENKKRYSTYKDDDIIHLVQSEYARLFLLSKNVGENKIFDLGDYLEDEVLSFSEDHLNERSNMKVLYNPKKGFELTSKLIMAAPHLEWVPLINMSKDEITKQLVSSKIYIDFGNHPGKDRFPREAVYCGCCILTGKRGAAENDTDIPIPENYKFADIDSSIPEIINQIEFVLNNYYTCVRDFSNYKIKIKNEREIFDAQVKSIFLKI